MLVAGTGGGGVAGSNGTFTGPLVMGFPFELTAFCVRLKLDAVSVVDVATATELPSADGVNDTFGSSALHVGTPVMLEPAGTGTPVKTPVLPLIIPCMAPINPPISC
jgi:hypothetical protein